MLPGGQLEGGFPRRRVMITTQHGSERLLTTHVGSLPRPPKILDLMASRTNGRATSSHYEACLSTAVRESVRQQADSGIDIITDGELSKTGFSAYTHSRLTGLETRPEGKVLPEHGDELAAFPEYYEQYLREAMVGSSVLPIHPTVCVGPIEYIGHEYLRRDIDNLTSALADAPSSAGAFMTAVAPSGLGGNDYYETEEEFLLAAGGALRAEYQAIIDAGFLLQIDDPYLFRFFANRDEDIAKQQRRADAYVEILNHCLRGLPAESIRYHTCYGINEGPRTHDVPFAKFVRSVLKVDAMAYSFEAANPRHEHEYHIWEDVKLPEGKVVLPGVIAHVNNIVEHPELVAERLIRFADRVGRENVIGSVDCGFSSQATYRTEVHPTVIWAKFRALREGANLASAWLWR
jgi:5-methyltetrahydropteroyltriglutamate--homocysteine methyltransferase